MNDPAKNDQAKPVVLRLSGIEKVYNKGKHGEVPVLRSAGLEIRAGEMVALVAPSGTGKSTLLHIAGLLDTPDTGDVEICGEAMNARSEQGRTMMRRNRLGFVYQFHHLLPEFSAIENITLPQLANGAGPVEAERRALQLLETVGLADRRDHRPAALSGGEAQRVAICRALANEPRLLLADEPTGNLDPATSDRVFDALMTLAQETGLAALVATHNLDLAARMDRVVRLDAGYIVEG